MKTLLVRSGPTILDTGGVCPQSPLYFVYKSPLHIKNRKSLRLDQR